MHHTLVVRVINGLEVPYGPPSNSPVYEERSTAGPHTRGRGLRQPEQDGGSPTGDRVGVGQQDRQTPAGMGLASKELRRKLAWAVGSVWGVRYSGYDTWPAEYARRASERLIEIHGEP